MQTIQTIRRFKLEDEEDFPSAGGAEVPSPETLVNLLQENQKLISIGRLTASIAHEINNPLESVTNLLFLAGLERDLSPEVRSYLTLAQKELRRVAQISKQTLNFTRDTPAPAPVSMEELVEEVLLLYGRKIAEKSLSIRREYHSTPTATVFPGQIRQVLSNLMVNAIEAAAEGGTLWLRIRSGRQWSDEGVEGLRIIIADNGSGIDTNTRQRLGTPFVTTKGQDGTGLGLWVAMSILRRNGGRLQIYSSTHPDRHGTVFCIFLPTNMRPRAVERRSNGSVLDIRDKDSSLGAAG